MVKVRKEHLTVHAGFSTGNGGRSRVSSQCIRCYLEVSSERYARSNCTESPSLVRLLIMRMWKRDAFLFVIWSQTSHHCDVPRFLSSTLLLGPFSFSMDDFSVWDQIRACLHCTRRPDIESDDDLEGGPSSQRPELDRLLFDSEHDATDIEADAMSLHSNVGLSPAAAARRRSKKKRRGMGKTVKIFGYDLFGRPRLADPSPNQSEDEEQETSALVNNPRRPTRAKADSSSRGTTATSASLDPDAEPLPDEAIATLSSPSKPSASTSTSTKWDAPLTDEQIRMEEEMQKEKEERKARRAAKRLAKQQRAEAEADAAAGFGDDIPSPLPNAPRRHHDGEQFEGFPGGNATLARDAVVPPSFDAKDDGEFGPWIAGNTRQNRRSPIPPQLSQQSSTTGYDYDDSEDDAADAGGEYNRRSRASANSGSAGDSSSRPSRSHHSHTSSVVDGSAYASRPRRGHSVSLHPSAYNVPLPPSSAGSYHGGDTTPQLPQFPAKKTKKRSIRSRSSATSESASLQSPAPYQESFFPSQGVVVEPSLGGGSDHGEPSIRPSPLQTRFPSTGFGGSLSSGKRSPFLDAQGAALARSAW